MINIFFCNFSDIRSGSAPGLPQALKTVSTASSDTSGATLKRGSSTSLGQQSTLPPKKRKIPSTNVKTEAETRRSQSQGVGGTVDSSTEDAKKKLQEDYDTFIRQVGELAALEREKNKLLEKFLAVSGAVSGSGSNESDSAIPPPPADDAPHD